MALPTLCVLGSQSVPFVARTQRTMLLSTILEIQSFKNSNDFSRSPRRGLTNNPDFCVQLYSASALGLHLLLPFCYLDYYFSLLLGYNPFSAKLSCMSFLFNPWVIVHALLDCPWSANYSSSSSSRANRPTLVFHGC